MKQAITRIVQANSAINNNAHNHYAEPKTDTELNAAVWDLLTTYSGIDNIIDSGNNERLGIENGVVKYPDPAVDINPFAKVISHKFLLVNQIFNFESLYFSWWTLR